MRTQSRRTDAVLTISLIFISLLLAIPVGCRDDQMHTGVPVAIDVECGANLGLTPESGIKIDWDEREQTWSHSVDAGQITLIRDGLCGDECNFVETLILSNISDPCPQLVSATYMHTDVGGARGTVSDTTWAIEGTFKIEKWEYPDGVLSGTLETEVAVTFYISLIE